MSIFRSETVCGNNPITTLHTKIEYILAPGKTIPKYCIALRGNYYSRDYIAMEIAMFQNKRLHGVINGKAYDHFIIRPDSEQDEDLSNETMWAASKAISQYLCNQCPIGRHFLGILALHLDSFDEIPHVHF